MRDTLSLSLTPGLHVDTKLKMLKQRWHSLVGKRYICKIETISTLNIHQLTVERGGLLFIKGVENRVI